MEEQRKRFIADVSHELKTPLTVLKGTCEGLKDGVLKEKQEEYYQMMLEEINEMSTMIGELLEISQVESETLFTKEAFELSEILLKVYHHLKPLVLEKEIKVLKLGLP